MTAKLIQRREKGIKNKMCYKMADENGNRFVVGL
jgi:hypothetical protein